MRIKWVNWIEWMLFCYWNLRKNLFPLISTTSSSSSSNRTKRVKQNKQDASFVLLELSWWWWKKQSKHLVYLSTRVACCFVISLFFGSCRICCYRWRIDVHTLVIWIGFIWRRRLKLTKICFGHSSRCDLCTQTHDWSHDTYVETSIFGSHKNNSIALI